MGKKLKSSLRLIHLEGEEQKTQEPTSIAERKAKRTIKPSERLG